VRVVLLVTDLEPGGTPLRLAQLAIGLRDAGLEVCVGCLARPGPVTHRLREAGVPTFACRARRPRDLTALRRLYRHLYSLRPDLIHATLTHANVAARLVGRVLRVPVLTSTATIEVERRSHVLLERLTARLDDGHVVHSQALADHVVRTFCIPPERVHVVPPFVTPPSQVPSRTEARRQFGLPADAFVVTWIGRFDPIKRLERLVRAVELMHRGDTVYALLVGDGPRRLHIGRLVRRSPAADRFRLAGWLDDPSPALAAADCLALCSRTEGVPNAVLQAMALGRPVVAADIAALRELADNGRRILLVPDGASAALAAALRRLRHDAALRQRLARSAANWARGLSLERTVRALIKIYEFAVRPAAERPLTSVADRERLSKRRSEP